MGCNPAIAPDDNSLSIKALRPNRDSAVLVSVIDGPNCATRADQRVISDFNSTGGVQLRIGIDEDIAPEDQPFREMDQYAFVYMAAGLRLISI